MGTPIRRRGTPGTGRCARRRTGRCGAPLGHLDHLVDAAARRIHLQPQFAVRGAGVQAQAAVDAAVQVELRGAGCSFRDDDTVCHGSADPCRVEHVLDALASFRSRCPARATASSVAFARFGSELDHRLPPAPRPPRVHPAPPASGWAKYAVHDARARARHRGTAGATPSRAAPPSGRQRRAHHRALGACRARYARREIPRPGATARPRPALRAVAAAPSAASSAR